MMANSLRSSPVKVNFFMRGTKYMGYQIFSCSSFRVSSIAGIENERKQVKNEELIAKYFRSANDQ